MRKIINGSQQKQDNALKSVKPWSINVQARVFQIVSDLLAVGFSVRHALQFCEILFQRQGADLHLINEQLQGGVTVSTAFEPFVDEQIGLQLQLAEEHGQLTQSLGQVSRLMQSSYERHQKIKRLLQYPLILVLILGVIITAMKVVILPQIDSLSSTSAGAAHNWWSVVGLIPVALIVICIYQAIKQQPILKRVEQTATIPVIGPIIQAYYGYYFLSSLTIMFQGGLGIQEILVTLRRAKPTTLLYQLGGQLETSLAAGQPLADVLATYRFMPKELQLLFQSGKAQLTIVQELTALTELYYQRLTNRIEMLLTWIQPLSFVLIGSVIVGAYASLFLPMYHTIGGF